MPSPSKRLQNIMPSGKDGWEVHFEAWSRKLAGQDIVMLSVGDHDFDTPTETVEAAVRAVRAGHHHYTQLSGIPALRRAMAKISTRSTGIETSADNIIATPGGQAALYAAVQAAFDPGDHAIVVAPYYATYPGTFRASGVEFTVVETRAEDGFQPDSEAILAAVQPGTRGILINSPNNPTGAIYSQEALERLASLCIERDLWLLSDEVYWALSETLHVSPRALPGMADRTLVINSMSKSHGMTGWRIGWLTAPETLIPLLTSLNIVTTYGLPDFVSRAAIDALEHDYGVREIAVTYARRREAFLEALRGSNDLLIRGSDGGMYIMLDVRALEADCEKFAFALLDAENVAVMPGGSFGDAAKGHIRIALTQPEPVLKDAAMRLRRFASSYRKNAA